MKELLAEYGTTIALAAMGAALLTGLFHLLNYLSALPL